MFSPRHFLYSWREGEAAGFIFSFYCTHIGPWDITRVLCQLGGFSPLLSDHHHSSSVQSSKAKKNNVQYTKWSWAHATSVATIYFSVSQKLKTLSRCRKSQNSVQNIALTTLQSLKTFVSENVSLWKLLSLKTSVSEPSASETFSK